MQVQNKFICENTALKYSGKFFSWGTLRVLATLLCSILLWAQTVYAGTINEAEQTVINYYERTFYYQGKNYAATEAAKASVYEKMMSDDVELTEAQAQSAIRQASKNIAQGIAKGYLVELDAEEEPKEDGESEDGKELEDRKEPETGEGKEDKKEPVTDQNQGNVKEPEADGNQGNTKEPEMDGNKEDAKESNIELEEKPSSEHQKKEKEEKIPSPYKKLDIEQFKKKTLQENSNAKVETGNHGKTVTVEQYSEGKLTAVTEDGYLLFSGELPIKNTGYCTGNFLIAAWLFFITLTGCITAAIGWIRGAKYEKE